MRGNEVPVPVPFPVLKIIFGTINKEGIDGINEILGQITEVLIPETLGEGNTYKALPEGIPVMGGGKKTQRINKSQKKWITRKK